MILATWLSQAAVEEQTSVLFIILKVCVEFTLTVVNDVSGNNCLEMHISTSVQVLCHLPLHKALPVHMSAILQSVNRLRFYRASGVPLLMKLVFCFSFLHHFSCSLSCSRLI